MSKQLIRIEATPALLEVNFTEVKAALEQRVAQYDIVVTQDTVADAKKLATELNRQKSEIEAKRKAAVAEVSEPIKVFDAQMKELSGLYETGRQKILVQVQRFEDATRDLARQLLEDQRESFWSEMRVSQEHRRAEFGDLVKLTAVTKTGNLAAAARGELEKRCRDDRALQDRTEMRLMQLENRSYKAGLEVPLTRDHVESFLMADDERYEAEIERIIAAEVRRQDEIERLSQERAAKAMRAQEAMARQAAERERPSTPDPEDEMPVSPTSDPPPQAAEPTPAPPPPQEGKRAWRVTCTFDLEVRADIQAEAIEGELRRVMEGAGIKTLSTVRAESFEVAA